MTGRTITLAQRRAAAAKPPDPAPAPPAKQKPQKAQKAEKAQKSQEPKKPRKPYTRRAQKPETQKPKTTAKTTAKSLAAVSTVEVGEETDVDATDSDASEMDGRHARGLQELDQRVSDVRESCWTSESLFEDVIEGVEDAKFDPSDPEACKPDEAFMLRQLLRNVGPTEFCRRTIDSGRYSVKRLLSAFGVKAPAFLEGAGDDAYMSLLALAFSRELSKRAKLNAYNTLEDAITLIRRSQNIMVITGAGISTSLGVPDFRSKNTGLYAQLEKMGLAINDPQEVFDISVFRDDPTIFFSVAKEILVKTKQFSPTHHFIAQLDRMGKLLTNYTQNIDNIEALAGIDPARTIQCHGSFATATCLVCAYKCPGDDIAADIHAGHIPKCPRCIEKLAAARAVPAPRGKRKRSAGVGSTASSSSAASRKRAAANRRRTAGLDFSDDEDEDDNSDFDIPQPGIMKPDITFFGEDLPDAFGRRLATHDRDRVDLVLVIGTSLKVTPVSEIVSWLPSHVPQICISLDPIQHMNFDIDLLGECDIVVAELARRVGFPLTHDMIPANQAVSVATEEGFLHRHRFTQTHPAKSAKQAEPTLILKGPKK
ncbi:DHS-like NAD/FAD-binding domain-containing protein [Plectosphaerella plurivora]|uniref:DHS-like NAD/FAD-binding domain-containing protein n=1 Tax=Plectosphaerella plurivora TaxID=936078 RepID=A0A9P8VGE0_9PEZI|nr:DHS-like NAD/FAD-binding domain-containing protein [Plectosphaerella plurivora]